MQNLKQISVVVFKLHGNTPTHTQTNKLQVNLIYIDNASGCQLGEQFAREPSKILACPSPGSEENWLKGALG